MQPRPIPRDRVRLTIKPVTGWAVLRNGQLQCVKRARDVAESYVKAWAKDLMRLGKDVEVVVPNGKRKR